MTESSKLHNELLTLTADIVSSHFANNTVAPADIPSVIATVYASLSKLGSPIEHPIVRREPAVSVRASIKPDVIICLEDGKKLKMLKPYLKTRYGMTPDQYRIKWGLPADYPMVAANYSERRRALAKSIGLGTKRVAKVAAKPSGGPRKVGA